MNESQIPASTGLPDKPLLFSLGQLVATPGALQALEAHQIAPSRLVSRHVTGDWGTVAPEDAAANEAALLHGDRLLSAYEIAAGVRVWIITEHDRSVTTILLPEEY